MAHVLYIPTGIKAEVEDYFASLLPEEGCGFLVGNDGEVADFKPAENELHSPIAYRMNPADQIEIMLTAEERQQDILAIIHSHPTGPETLSRTDIHEANWFELSYVIISFADQLNPVWRNWYLTLTDHKEMPIVFKKASSTQPKWETN